LFEFSNLRAEKENLEKENLRLKTEIERLKEIKRENQILKKALNLKEKGLEVLPAKVAGKDPDQDTILIDKGKKDGVFEGEVAISPEGVLLGRVLKVYPNFSKIALISSKNFNFNCKIFSREFECLLEGRGNLNLYLTLLPKEKKIEIGDRISTSALGGKFPAGIFVGEIEKIEKSDIKPYQEAKIKLGFSLSDLEFVFLVKNFKPWKES
jgi:rod shape-determining protein MreC